MANGPAIERHNAQGEHAFYRVKHVLNIAIITTALPDPWLHGGGISLHFKPVERLSIIVRLNTPSSSLLARKTVDHLGVLAIFSPSPMFDDVIFVLKVEDHLVLVSHVDTRQVPSVLKNKCQLLHIV